jgi:hypothetical protein
MPGTGDAISFGEQQDEGLYSVMAYTSLCSTDMLGQVYVFMLELPEQAATPAGPESVCNNENSDYTTTGASNSDTLIWTLTPPEAGTIVQNGEEALVEWSGDYIGMAYLSVYGENDCGAGDPSGDLEITVNGTPDPEVEGVTEVCVDFSEQYSTDLVVTSTYSWEVSGGTITDGQGTESINVLWDIVGQGMVSVTEEGPGSCAATDSLMITVDDCTGQNEKDGTIYTIYPNPASENVTIHGTRSSVVMIYGTQGNRVEQFTLQEGSEQLDISGYSKGIYLVRFIHKDKVTTQRLIKR